MRIALEYQAAAREATTGIGQYARCLRAALDALEEEIELLPLIPRHPAGRFGTLRRLVWEQVEVPRAAARAHADLIHSPGFAAPLRARVPRILSLHDLLGLTDPSLLRGPGARFYWGHVVPRAASSCDHLIVPSRHTCVTVQERLKIPVERISLVPLAPARRPDPPAVEVTSKRPERCILFVGSIEPRKDTSLLVRAYALLPVDLRRVFPLVICGPDGGDMKRLRRTVAARHLEGWVHVLGFASERELARLYTRAALVVHPSLGEGFGMTPLEAMQAGAPVVALAAGAVPEVVGDAAVLVPPPFEDEALASAMQRVLESPDLRSALVEAGRRRAAEFTWERTARATLEVYRKVLGGMSRYVYRSAKVRSLVRVFDSLGATARLLKRRRPLDPLQARRILAVNLNHVGDVVLSTGAFAAIKRACPSVHLTALVAPWSAPLLDRSSDLDELLVHDASWRRRGSGRKTPRPSELRTLAARLRARDDEVFVDLGGDLFVNLLGAAAKVPLRFGFKGYGGAFCLDHAVFPDEQIHQLCTFEKLLAPLGVRPGQAVPHLELSPEEVHAARLAVGEVRPSGGGRLIALHPGGGRPEKVWPAERFARVIDSLREEPVAIALVGGEGDRAAGSSLSRLFPELIDWLGLDLREMAARIGAVDAFVGPDSAPAHIAAVLDIPGVVIFSGGDSAARWRPVGPRLVPLAADAGQLVSAEIVVDRLQCLLEGARP